MPAQCNNTLKSSGQCRLFGCLTSKLSLSEESRASCRPPSCACTRMYHENCKMSTSPQHQGPPSQVLGTVPYRTF